MDEQGEDDAIVMMEEGDATNLEVALSNSAYIQGRTYLGDMK